ncbi:unnamed protein product [Kluyveromyces dobzhanskii CBS 2104]|uniref:WGS project CCBQ000000000 data, contig 00098 n=1 Tax=Kluyveromyces dobzhanskii CBS 2104 TaxID=1427455 RepID=A0A0A8L5M9_9SACH|nr:unnamed protein product [Kluyveromyces dobzhanskii CBS 2104]
MADPKEPEQPATIDEEYDLWVSNVPIMYDFVSETRLTWPSLTVQWLPTEVKPRDVDGQKLLRQELLIGTLTTDEEPNYLKIAAIDLPENVASNKTSVTDDDENNELSHRQSKIKIVKKFKHELEVTRARFMPQSPNIIATLNGAGTVYIFDRDVKEKDSGAIASYTYHKENGYGLAFNPNVSGQLLSASDDSTVALWDVSSTASTSPSQTFNVHTDIVNDCKWHEFKSNLFGTVSEDSTLIIHDSKSGEIASKLTVSAPFNTLAFSKHSENLIAAAGTDSNVYIYDLRNLNKPLHSMAGHEDSVTSLEFSVHQDGLLTSSGSDRRVIMWDLLNIGAEQQQGDADDGAPELFMMHGGHRSPVNEFSHNPNVPWLMCSVEEENVLQIWKPASKIVHPPQPPVDLDIRTLE